MTARVLFLTKYGCRAASTRHRFVQFFPSLERAGFSCEMSPLLDDRYLEAKFDRQTSDLIAVAYGTLVRLMRLLTIRRYQLVVVHMEALPYLPSWFEAALRQLRVPFVYDFDDASFHQYDQHRSSVVRRLYAAKIGRVMGNASLVIAGNDYLADYAGRFNRRVIVIPTVVDTRRFVPGLERRPETPVVVGWIGSPSTASYLTDLAAVWRAVTSSGKCSLRLVGSGAVHLPGSQVEVRPWTWDAEVDDLQSFDIGIMPLPDDSWARGKCGFKLIQYMACAVPVVASPVGVNKLIVKDGENGFLCATPQEWVSRLDDLVSSASLRRRLGHTARTVVDHEWSLTRWAPELARNYAATIASD